MEDNNQVVNNEQPTAQTQEQVQNVQPGQEQPAPEPKDNFGERLNRAWGKMHDIFKCPDDIRGNKDRNVLKKWYTDFSNDAISNKAKADELSGKLETITGENYNLKKEVAFLRNKIDPSKENDILAIIKGNNKEFTEENLLELLPTHPEWLLKEEPKAAVHIGQHADIQTPKAETFEEKKKRIYGL